MPSAEPSPRPWHFVDPFDDGFPVVRDANERQVATLDGETPDTNEANAALIVDAVNERDRLRSELDALQTSYNELHSALSDKARNYEDVIAYHMRTEEGLRDIVRRLEDLSESLLANYEYRYREDANSMAFVENTRGFLREARAAIGEDGK